MNINLPDLRYKTEALRVQSSTSWSGGCAHCRAFSKCLREPHADARKLASGFELENAKDNSLNPVLTADFQAVNSGYFETLGIALVRGRRLTPHDREVSRRSPW